MKKRIISLLLALIMALSLLPVSVLAADDHTGQVHVTVENTTWAKTDGAPWEGTLVDEWVTLKADSTMMSCIVDALTAKGYSQTGADTGYISSINGNAVNFPVSILSMRRVIRRTSPTSPHSPQCLQALQPHFMQPALFFRPRHSLPQLSGGLHGLGLFPGNTLLVGLVVHAHGVHGVGSRLRGQLPGQHVVPGVAVGNLDHLSLFALSFYILQQNYFHCNSLLNRYDMYAKQPLKRRLAWFILRRTYQWTPPARPGHP